MISLPEEEHKFLDLMVSSMNLFSYTENDSYRKFDAETGFMPVHIDVLRENVVAVAHYGVQNGDAMKDPEIIFYRNSQGFWYACTYRNDFNGVNQNAVLFSDNGKPERFKKELQKELNAFCKSWFTNIKNQQKSGVYCKSCTGYGMLKEVSRPQTHYVCLHCGVEVAV